MAQETEAVNQLGKRYVCQKCGVEVLCVKGGTGVVHCCDKKMEQQKPKVLPSAD